jgi:arginyl-tRNA synthetase
MLSFEGDTGPYLQYAHARLCSIERKCSPMTVDRNNFIKVNHALLDDPRAGALIDCIALFPDAVKETAFNKEPTTLVKYSLRLSHCVSTAVTQLYVQNQQEDIALARLAMYKAARFTLGNALRMLGLVPLERM